MGFQPHKYPKIRYKPYTISSNSTSKPKTND